jgi:hypothetical protein
MTSKPLNTAIVLTLVATGCNPCDLETEVARVLQGQSPVINCGHVHYHDSRAVATAVAECMTQAVQDRRPFRASGRAVRDADYVYFGRVMGSSYEVRGLSYTAAPVSIGSYLCESPSFRVRVYNEDNGGTDIVWNCSNQETPWETLPPQPRYDPPMHVPIGQICPVQETPRRR